MKFLKQNKIWLAILVITLFISIQLRTVSAVTNTISQVPYGGTGVNTITGIPYGTGTAPLSIVTVGTGLSFSGGTLSATGSGAVSSVSNSDGTLTISPTTGSVVASIALGHANTWTGQQTFSTSAPIISTATASTIAGFDDSKNLITLATATYPSLTELSYVKGVTSAIQTQLNAKGTFTLPSLTSGSVLYSDGSTIAQDNSNFFWDSTNHNLRLGPTDATIVSENRLSVIGNANDYSNIYVRNQNAGNMASDDITWANDSTNPADYFDIGLNSSTNANPTYTGFLPNDAYIYTSGAINSINIATGGNNPIRFFTNGTLLANQRMTILGNGNVGIGNSSPVDMLDVGSSTTGGNIAAFATVGSELMPALTGSTGTNWTYDATWTQSGTTFAHSSNGTTTLTPSGATAIVAGTLYKVVITTTAFSTGNFSATLGGISTTISTVGTFTNYISSANTGNLTITPSSTSRFTISAISVKAVSTTSTGELTADGNIQSRSVIGFLSPSGVIDTGMTRNAAGSIVIGNGTLNSANGSILAGTVTANTFIQASTNFRLSGSGLQLSANSSNLITFTPNTGNPAATSGIDTGISRSGIGIIAIGNGTASDYSGTLIAGKVGVGTATPGSLLDINGALTATSSNNYSSGAIRTTGNYWNGSASAADYWSVQNVLGTGNNPTSTLTFSHSGSSGASTVSIGSKLTVNGHIGTLGTIPTLTSAGTGASITTGSTDTAGEITEGTLATGAVITFATAYTNAPFVTITSESGLAFSYTVSNTAITITNIGALSSTKLMYTVVANGS